MLNAGKLLLIDVREPGEFAAERIPGAFLYPLSSFDASALPADGERRVVFHCRSGKRSLRPSLTGRSIESLRDASPIHHVPPGMQPLRAAIIVFQVVRMLP